ncbi:MAG TPA: polysaccharide deacetylase family protein [Phycisphaerae bacterium]|nr:polysaccharide deacetylase family protein [Phycisphaerae bacterium]
MPETTAILPLLLAGVSAGAVSAAAVAAYSVFSPRCQFWAPVIRGIPQRDGVALTFDDGPDAEVTPRILDILAAHNAPATFFVIGQHARAHPEVVRRIAAAGHVVGNHSLDHEHFGVNRNRAYWREQVNETQKIVGDITGHPPLLFRPPMGFKTRSLAAAVKEAGLPIVGWSVRGYDTRGVSAEKLASRLVRRSAGHDIVLMHDGRDPHRKKGVGQGQTAEALPGVLAGLAEKKLHVLPLVEALLHKELAGKELADAIQSGRS